MENPNQKVTAAARLLKSLANEHQQGNPIPVEIEQATDKWTWIKLQEHKEHKAYLHTGGRVGSQLNVRQNALTCTLINCYINKKEFENYYTIHVHM